MGAPDSGMQAAGRPQADELLSAFRTISPTERCRHANVLDYWLSIRGDKEFPPLHDLDPLELSDAGPNSMLLELISGGHDAEVRHLGDALKPYVGVESVIEAPDPSLLSCLAKKLPIVAISRDFLAFEDEFAIGDGAARCWVTLLPLSAGGAWVDYVYALVSLEATSAAEPVKKPAKKAEPEEPVAEKAEEPIVETLAGAVVEEADEPVAEEADEPVAERVEEPVVEEADELVAVEVDEPAGTEAQAEAQDEIEKAAEVAEPTDVEAPLNDEAEESAAEPEEAEAVAETIDEVEGPETAEAEAAPKATAGFSKLFDSLAGLTGFYGSQPVKLDPVIPTAEGLAGEPIVAAEEPIAEEPAAEEPIVEEAAVEEPVAEEPVAEEPVAEEPVVEEAFSKELVVDEPVEEPVVEAVEQHTKHPAPASEGTLQSKLTEVRAKADEARQARLRATASLYEGLSAAYDFAIDAEDAPEEYLRLVEAQGLKIQLRSPMKPVVKLAFADTCDDATIKQLEAVLSWALKEELPRGTLLERLEAEGGVAAVLKNAA